MTLVLDSSALVAIIEGEPEAEAFVTIIEAADALLIAAPTVFETMIVMVRRHGPGGIGIVQRLVAQAGADVVPFDARMAEAAGAAYARFGKGIEPRARLNLGDCVSYALARTFDAPLLFKGDDFAATDIRAAAP